MIALQSLFPVAVAAITTTLYFNLPAWADDFVSLPATLIGGSVLENISPDELPTNVAETILERAAIDSGLSISLLQIALAQRIMWNDGCMGIYTPNTACTMALVPGWRVLVTSDRQQWVYHSTEMNAWRSPELSVLPSDCF